MFNQNIVFYTCLSLRKCLIIIRAISRLSLIYFLAPDLRLEETHVKVNYVIGKHIKVYFLCKKGYTERPNLLGET